MTTNTNQAPIDQSRKNEDEQRARAEVARQSIDQLTQQVIEARMVDKHIQLKVDATQSALDEVKKKTEASRKAEAEAREATNNVQKAEADLKAVAAKLDVETRDAETTASQKKQQAAEAPSDMALQQAATEAENIAQAKRTSANTAKTAAEKPETDQNVADLRQKEQALLTASSKARNEETTALATLEKARREEEFFRSKLKSSGRWEAFLSKFSPLITQESLIGATLLVLGGIGIGIIGYAIFFTDFLVRVKDVNVARGLITFLVALSAVIIAMIVTLYAVVSTDKELLEKKFGFGKEIFTAFVGILGTIIGFYFATDHSGDSRTEPPPPFLSFDLSETHPGDEVKFTTLMYTGKPPFDWIISSMPQGITGHGSDPDGYIEAQVPIPADLSVDEYDIKLTVTDSEKNTIAEPVGKLKVIGTPTVAPPGSSTPVSELSVEPSEVKAGEPFTVKSKVPSDAGTDYEISLDPPVMITNNKDNVTTAGPIEKRVVIPADTTAGDYTVKLRVTDSMGKTLLETGKLKVIPQ
jgi:hypothetical protein